MGYEEQADERGGVVRRIICYQAQLQSLSQMILDTETFWFCTSIPCPLFLSVLELLIFESTCLLFLNDSAPLLAGLPCARWFCQRPEARPPAHENGHSRYQDSVNMAGRKRKKERENIGVYGTVGEHALIGRSEGGSME